MAGTRLCAHNSTYLTVFQAAALQATLQQLQQAFREQEYQPKRQQQQVLQQQQEKRIDADATVEAAHSTIAARGTLDAAGHVITPAAAAAAAAALEAAAAHHHQQQQQAWQQRHSCAFCGESFPSGEAFWAHCLMPHHMLQLLVRGQMQLGCGQLGLPALQGWWRQPLGSSPAAAAAAAARGAAVGTDDELAVLLEQQEGAEQQQQQRVATARSALRKLRKIAACIGQQQQQDVDDAAGTACGDGVDATQVAAGHSCQICSEEWVGEAQLLAHFM
jgi:predicted Zn-ribbon and HTH transcriptional regulator